MNNNQNVPTVDQSGMIVRTVKVNRTRSNQEALDAAGRKLHVDPSVVINAPQGKEEGVEVLLFKLEREISCSDLDKEYDLRGLSPADLQTISALNEQDPSFSDEHRNCTQWKNKDGKNCCADFAGSRYGRNTATVYQFDLGWGTYWWFVGVRKIHTQTSTTLNS